MKTLSRRQFVAGLAVAEIERESGDYLPGAVRAEFPGDDENFALFPGADDVGRGRCT